MTTGVTRAAPVAPAAADRLRWVALAVFVLSSALNFLDRQLLAALAPDIQREFSLDNRQFGWVVSAFSLTYALSAPVMGLLIDRLGLQRGAALAVAIWSLAGVATGFCGSLLSLIVCRAALGVGEAGGIPASGKTAAVYLRPRELALGSALSQLGLTVGGVAAPRLASWLAPLYGWRYAFVLAGLLGFAWLPLWWWTTRRIAAVNLPATTGQPPAVRPLLRDRRFWGIIAANILAMPGYSLWVNWTTKYFVTERQLSQQQANLGYAWVPPLFAMLGGLSGGLLAMAAARRERPMFQVRLRIMAVAGALAMATALVPAAPTAAWANAAICASLFWTVTLSVNLYAMPLDLYGPGRAAFTTSVLTGAYGLMQTVVSPWIGSVVDRQGYAPVCLAVAPLPLLAVALLAVVSRGTPDGHKRSDP